MINDQTQRDINFSLNENSDYEETAKLIEESKLKKENKQPDAETTISKSINIFKLQYELSNKYDYAVAISATIFSVFFGISFNVFEFVVGNSINHLIPPNPMTDAHYQTLKNDCFIYLYVGIATLVGAFFHCCLWYYNGKKLGLKYKTEYFRIILAQDQSWFDKQNVHEITSRVESQTRAIETGVYFNLINYS